MVLVLAQKYLYNNSTLVVYYCEILLKCAALYCTLPVAHTLNKRARIEWIQDCCYFKERIGVKVSTYGLLKFQGDIKNRKKAVIIKVELLY